MRSLLIFLPVVLVHVARKSSARLFEICPCLVAHNATILAAICVNVGAAMLAKTSSASL